MITRIKNTLSITTFFVTIPLAVGGGSVPLPCVNGECKKHPKFPNMRTHAQTDVSEPRAIESVVLGT